VLREAPPPMVSQTFLQANTGFGHMVLHVRTSRQGADIVGSVREAVQAIDSAVPMFAVHTLADEIDAALIRERLVATLSGGFGLVALGLVSLGLYGLLAFSVSRRTAEIGIRVALGATRADVLWLVGGQGLTIVLLGLTVLLVGVCAALHPARRAARIDPIVALRTE
jgi:macrolide transport system ATP-binding/permease protein